MTRAPSSGVRYFFSTAMRTSLISVSATFHFGSIVAPNSVGFIDANWWTSEGLTVSDMTEPPWIGERYEGHGAKPWRNSHRSLPQIPGFEMTHLTRSLRTIQA